jgi:hypothetical protein
VIVDFLKGTDGFMMERMANQDWQKHVEAGLQRVQDALSKGTHPYVFEELDQEERRSRWERSMNRRERPLRFACGVRFCDVIDRRPRLRTHRVAPVVDVLCLLRTRDEVGSINRMTYFCSTGPHLRREKGLLCKAVTKVPLRRPPGIEIPGERPNRRLSSQVLATVHPSDCLLIYTFPAVPLDQTEIPSEL